jgi:SAM-dependent methyltransferase
MDELVAQLEIEPQFLGDQWLEQLEDRKRQEASFHDADRLGHRDEIEREAGNAHWYVAAKPVVRHFREWIARESPGHVVLDYACGAGQAALEFARAGAAITVGIDISEVSVRNATENAEAAGVADRVKFLQRDCEATGLPDASFDRVLCSGMLHHLDLRKAFPELHRILKPGGRILCLEALSYNPLIRWYRRRTPQFRTVWETEHILSLREVRMAQLWFEVENLTFFCFTSPLATLLPSGRLRAAGLAATHAVDAVLTRVPLLRLWSWQFAFELVKR